MVAPNRSVRGAVHDGPSMFEVELTCGEKPCEPTVTVVEELAELEILVCDECRYCLHVLSISLTEYVDLPARTPLLLAA